MSKPTFFCIYSGRDHPESVRSLEHIVPYALGGTGEFGTRDVSTKANSDVGSIADGPLINYPLVTIQRWRLQLRRAAKSQGSRFAEPLTPTVPPLMRDTTSIQTGP